MKPIGQYIDAKGVLVTVYPEKKVKRNPYGAFGGSLALMGALAARGIPTEGTMFAMPTRRRIK